MKKIIFAFAIAAFSATAFPVYAQAPQEAAKKVDRDAPRFEFIGGDTHDFGNLTDQKDAEYTFRFKNTGKTPLVITNASPSCQCTTPDWTKEPVLPGKTGEIKVGFHTSGKSGPFQKSVFIQSNAPSNVGGGRYEIYIKGTVAPGAQTGNNTTAPAKG